MGQYKVPQNVEAEDKILGPLTLKQFIYVIIGLGWAFVCFFLFKSVIPVMLLVAAPVTLLFLLLGFYQRDGQNFEQLLVALVGFLSQERKRVWIKEPVVDSFKVEAVKVVEEQTQRNPMEVRGELEKLATLVDSRGWAEPHDTNGQLPVEAPAATPPASGRLVSPTLAPTSAGSLDTPSQQADPMDLQHSPLAQNLNHLLNQAAAEVKQEAVNAMANPVPQPPSVSVTTPAPGAILALATERDDLTVSQLAAQATREVPLKEGESVNLHTINHGQDNHPQPASRQSADQPQHAK